MKVYTFGHGARDIEDFLKIIKENKIDLIVDIREKPFSKYYPHFNRNSLEKKLRENNIEYIFAGAFLGGSSKFHNDLLEYIKAKGRQKSEISHHNNRLLELIDEKTREIIFSKAPDFSNSSSY
jgi:hypothetical protein